MHLMCRISFIACLLVQPVIASADLVKCTQPDGRSSYQDRPCESKTATSKVIGATSTASLSELGIARKNFKTQVSMPSGAAGPVSKPASAELIKTTYLSAVGPLAAYVSADPKDGAKHPAIVWITGGDSNSLDDMSRTGPRSNDQSASSYRKAGVVTMFPSLRGGNDNPGNKEAFYGEVDDVIAAADYLARQPYVDPNKIYLGGHSTGGTLVLLTSEMTTRFRAVFSFGPVGKVSSYSGSLLPVDFKKMDSKESSLRAPELWLSSIRSRVFVLEGASGSGNIGELKTMQRQTNNPLITFLSVAGASHFSILAPANDLIAQKILKDTGSSVQISLTEEELSAAMRSSR